MHFFLSLYFSLSLISIITQLYFQCVFFLIVLSWCHILVLFCCEWRHMHSAPNPQDPFQILERADWPKSIRSLLQWNAVYRDKGWISRTNSSFTASLFLWFCQVAFIELNNTSHAWEPQRLDWTHGVIMGLCIHRLVSSCPLYCTQAFSGLSVCVVEKERVVTVFREGYCSIFYWGLLLFIWLRVRGTDGWAAHPGAFWDPVCLDTTPSLSHHPLS